MVTLVIALMSPIATFDDELFFIHMWQHVLLTMVAPPLLLLGMPVTLILRACSPRWRNDVVLPLLHSRVASVILFPVVTWLFFVVTAWVTHFSPIYNASLSNDWIHIFEHAWYLFAGLLFWWHVVEADPGRWRLSHPARLLYMFAMMAQTTFLGLAFYSSNVVFYSGYEVDRGWGPSPLADQQAAGASIWIGGLAVSMITVFILVADWMEAEERSERRREEAAHTPRLH
jgi:putative copper resistance protein D